MFTWVSYRVAQHLKDKDVYGRYDADTLAHGFHLILNPALIVLFTVIVSLFFGNTLQAILAIATMGVLRKYSGGHHFRSSEFCVVFTAALVHACMLASSWIAGFIPYFMGLSVLLFAVFAPYRKNSLTRSERMKAKVITIGLTLIIWYIGNASLCTVALVQSIDIIPFGRKK